MYKHNPPLIAMVFEHIQLAIAPNKLPLWGTLHLTLRSYEFVGNSCFCLDRRCGPSRVYNMTPKRVRRQPNKASSSLEMRFALRLDPTAELVKRA